MRWLDLNRRIRSSSSGQLLRLWTNKGTVLASLTPSPSLAERKRLQVRAGSHNSTGLPSGSCILAKRPTSESYSARVSTSTPSFVSFAMRASRSSIAVQHGRNNRCLWRKAQKSSFRRPAAIPIYADCRCRDVSHTIQPGQGHLLL